MPYSTVALVQSEFRTIEFTATTAVTTSEVDQFIVEYDSLIDSKISHRYVAPVILGDSPISFSLLQMISRLLVAYRIRDILEVKNVVTDSAKQDTRGGLTREDLMKMLDNIQSGALPLVDAIVNEKTGVFMSSGNVDNSVEKFFEDDKDQW